MYNLCKRVLFGILVFIATESFGQNININFKFYKNREIPKISNDMIEKDFNELCYFLKNLMPLNNFYKSAGIIDLDTIFSNYRKELDTITSMDEFYRIVDEILTIYNDGHLCADMNGAFIYPNSLLTNSIINVDSLSIENTRTFISKRYQIASHIRLRMKIKYINGKYFNVLPFVYDNDTIFCGAELLKINGQEVNSFVSNKNKYTIGMKWDVVNKQYYTEYFLLSNYVAQFDSIEITYNNINKLLTQKYDLRCSLNFIDTLDKDKRKESNLVKYIPETESLVIRMATLYFLKDDILDSIKSCFNTNVVSNVIFDFRGNKGGKDEVWENVVSLVIGPYQHVENICGINSYEYKKYMAYLYNNDSISYISVKFDYLDGTYACSEFVRSLPKLDTSFFYKGQIFIFIDDNIFSGTYNFLNFLTDFSNVTTIGEQSGYIYYPGNQPMNFRLSNSGIIIKTPINFCSNGRRVDNIFFKPDIIVNENIPAVYKYLSIPDKDYYSHEMLEKYDVYYQEFLKIVRQNGGR